MQPTHTRLLLLAMLATAPAGAQTYSSGAAAPAFKRVMVPCSASPIFDLAKGTAFQINLCSTPSTTPQMRNLGKADGKIVAFLVCQDSTGGRQFVWPSIMIAATPAPDLPGWCIAQNFLVAGANLWATSTGARQSLISPPSMLSPPLTGGAYYNPGAFTLTDATYGVTASSTLARATGFTSFYFDALAGNYDGGNAACRLAHNCPVRTATVMFYLDAPPAGTTQTFGINFNYAASADPGAANPALTCAYQFGNGVNQVTWLGHYWRLTNDDLLAHPIASLGAASFTTPGDPMMLRASQDANGAMWCQYSTDRGATWAANLQTDWGTNVTAGHIGLIAKQPDAADRVYILGLSVIE